MKRTWICRLAAILTAVQCGIFTAFSAETKSEKDTLGTSLRLDAVAVTGSRIPIALGKSARIVTLMDSTAIASLPVESVNDLLKYVAGIDVRQRGDMGAQTDISMRGGTSDQIGVYLDGINICDPQNGHNTVDLPVDISEIERVEILSGPAGVAYGSSSLTGAINIITKKSARSEVSAHAEGGSFGFFNGGVRVSAVTGKVTNSISAAYLRRVQQEFRGRAEQ